MQDFDHKISNIFWDATARYMRQEANTLSRTFPCPHPFLTPSIFGASPPLSSIHVPALPDPYCLSYESA